MIEALKDAVRVARRRIAAGDSGAVERLYLPGALLLGGCIGAAVALASDMIGVLVLVAGGFGGGYATRAFISYRRRQAAIAATDRRPHF